MSHNKYRVYMGTNQASLPSLINQSSQEYGYSYIKSVTLENLRVALIRSNRYRVFSFQIETNDGKWISLCFAYLRTTLPSFHTHEKELTSSFIIITMKYVFYADQGKYVYHLFETYALNRDTATSALYFISSTNVALCEVR